MGIIVIKEFEIIQKQYSILEVPKIHPIIILLIKIKVIIIMFIRVSIVIVISSTLDLIYLILLYSITIIHFLSTLLLISYLLIQLPKMSH